MMLGYTGQFHSCRNGGSAQGEGTTMDRHGDTKVEALTVIIKA
jgi:hypothetical protein